VKWQENRSIIAFLSCFFLNIGQSYEYFAKKRSENAFISNIFSIFAL
jgi:amino acid permease